MWHTQATGYRSVDRVGSSGWLVGELVVKVAAGLLEFRSVKYMYATRVCVCVCVCVSLPFAQYLQFMFFSFCFDFFPCDFFPCALFYVVMLCLLFVTFYCCLCCCCCSPFVCRNRNRSNSIRQ